MKIRRILAALVAAVAIVGIGAPMQAHAGAGDSRPAPTSDLFRGEFPGFKGYTQEHATWCYAAVTQVVQEAFGSPVASQAEIAHGNVYKLGTSLMVYARENSMRLEEHAATYYVDRLNQYAQRQLSEGAPDRDFSDWNVVSREVLNSFRLREVLYHVRGNPDLDGRKSRLVSSPTDISDDDFIEIIENLGLVVILANGHYTVIHGYEYEIPLEGVPVMRLKIWDPLQGAGEKVLTADSVRDNAQNLTIITG